MGRGKLKAELKAELDEAHGYIEELETMLDDIAGVAADEEDEDETDEGQD
ncbi:MAG: hypothetical protein LLG20_16025 [Acidobacteriales bacterium]|nr:hypothetical protein [Terriglobales bacterium]